MPLLLVWLLVAAHAPGVGAQRDLASYLGVAARYRSPDRAAALREIFEWRSAEIAAAVGALRRAEGRIRAVPVHTLDIDFRTVESAVLMHANAGLTALRATSPVDAEAHLGVSISLFEWSRGAARRLRERASRPPRASAKNPPEPPASALLVRERIARRDYYVALAAASLALGFPATARPFAEEATREAPTDAEVRLLCGCVFASLAEEVIFRHQDSDATLAREDAERALRDALLLDRGLQEARLRLGKLLVDERRMIEAEGLLAEVEERTPDDRQRYLARLLLGRVADGRGRTEQAARFYGRALEAWPDSQAARLALGHALERSTGPSAATVLVGATLSASRRLDRTSDPWWLLNLGPPSLAEGALVRVWERVLER